ncbi:receptor activity-modifying protein 1-like isoform X1 [Salvelinus fontinalis]|uniref:receptor activity-modifying protein 1-like isoform X1 n=1 Tax=Salvelinus fontinalis TaxID=8038 RepID=UPI00248524CC|nr:receptor activity-modifying protein 1-like isoform X1 [Salvelinus fontinalis]
MKAPNPSPVSSSSCCFLTLLLWALSSTAAGLIGHYEAPQATTPGFTLRHDATRNTNDQNHDIEERRVSSGLGCGNTYVNCEQYCEVCEYFPPRTECYATLFMGTCYINFVSAMESLNNTDWCNWNNVKRMYNTFTMCTEEIAECLLIPWPNRMVENEFVNIHSRFFRDCPNEALSDPPPSIVFALVMTPICLIPIMVVLVVLKTKNGDGSS